VPTLPGQDEGDSHGRREHRGQVPDGGHVELAQAAEDVPGKHQDHQVRGGQGAEEPGPALLAGRLAPRCWPWRLAPRCWPWRLAPRGERDHDGRHHHVGRPHVGQVPARRRQLAGVHPVGDDALADQRPDHLAGQADQRRPAAAQGPVRAEQGQRDQHRPGHEEPRRDERRHQQRQHRLVLQVRHVRAGPGDQLSLGGRVELAVDELGGHEAGSEGAGERVPGAGGAVW
jgi:hypothetical protein